MSTINNGGRAFPGPDQTECTVDINEGMTLRDYFAAKAMLGAITGESPWRGADYKPDNRLSNIENDARLAYMYADAMLRARGDQ
jgi:hypothetical protein